LIGQKWINITDAEGNRRLDNPLDFVRIEVSRGLERNIKVIPVMVDGAQPVKAEQLPENLKPLARRNVLFVGDQFNIDMDRLVPVLERTLEDAKEKREREKAEAKRQAKQKAKTQSETDQERIEKPRWQQVPVWGWIGGVIALFLIVYGIVDPFPPTPTPTLTPTTTHTAILTDTPTKPISETGELEIFYPWGREDDPALEALITLYNELYPDVEVINATVGYSYEAVDEIKARLQEDDPPDTFQIRTGSDLISTWVATEKMEDLTFLYEEEGWFGKYPQGLIDIWSTEDGIWSVPIAIYRSNVMFFNRVLFDEWGLDNPSSWHDWNDFLEICPILQEGGIVPLAVSNLWSHEYLWESVAMSELGVEGWKALWTGELAWTDPSVVRVWDTFGAILECSNSYAGALSLSWDRASDMVIYGQAAVNVMGDWANGYLETSMGLTPEVDYDWAPSPGTVGIFMVVSDSFGLPKGAPNRENVLNWLRLIGSVEGQDAFNPLVGSIAAHFDSDRSKYSVYSQSAAADWASDEVVGSLWGGVANDAFTSGFITIIEDYLNSGDAIAASAASEELCEQAGICQ
jgi:glucose/mannose transport system substrate-binding protein